MMSGEERGASDTLTISTRSRVLGLAALLLAAACASDPGPVPTPEDAGFPDDVQRVDDVVDVPTFVDVPLVDDHLDVPIDASFDARADTAPDVAPDASAPGDPCHRGLPYDLLPLAAAGSAGIDSDNRSVPMESTVAAPCGPRVGHVQAYRYVPTFASARIEVTVRGAGGAALGFDAVTWVLGTCAPLGVSFGCAASDHRQPAVVTTTGRVTRGVPVFVLVGGDLTGSPVGAYTVVVREVDPASALGDACNAARPCSAGLRCELGACEARAAAGEYCAVDDVDACVEGTSCNLTEMGSRRCTPTGAYLGGCRTRDGATPCDPGLRCVDATCQREVAPGGTCGTRGLFCAVGSNCIEQTGTRRCLVDGGRGAACRRAAGAVPCDGADVCSLDRCVPTVEAGAACDANGVLNACTAGYGCDRSTRVCVTGLPEGAGCFSADHCLTGLECVTDTVFGPADYLCRRRGARGGRCHTEGVPCDGALTCSESTCHVVIPWGEPCDTVLRHDVCAPGGRCRFAFGSARCIGDGALAGECRLEGSRRVCDAGLTCDAFSCYQIRTVGDACTSTDTYTHCPDASTCRGPTDALRCLADGSLGGRCRQGSLTPYCDPGSGCTNPIDRAYGVCVTAREPGETCDPDRRADVCKDDGICAPRGGQYVCLANGAPGGRCRTITSTVTACVTGACGVDYVCPVAAGDEGGTCRSTNPACGGGLACNDIPLRPTCRPALAGGQPCDVTGARNACIAPARCTTAPGMGTFACR